MAREAEPTRARTSRDEPTSERPGGLAPLLAVTFLAFMNYSALLSVVPLWTSVGGASSGAVGSTTGVMMAATVITQMAMPWLFRLFALRTMAIAGTVLLGAPTPLYALSTDLVPVLGLTAVRGVGFGFVVMAGATLVADIAPDTRLARSAALYGAAAALPNLAALGGGVWLAQTWGFGPVFWTVGSAALIGGVLAFGLPGANRGSFRFRAATDALTLIGPIGRFLLTAGTFGAATTFLPVAVRNATGAALALLAASLALVAGRLAAGTIGDRFGSGRLLLPSALASAAGLAITAFGLDGGVPLLIGAALFGAGFGAAQNDSFVAVLRGLGSGHHGTASTLWNIAYDGGLGAGGVMFGWLVRGTGYSLAFLILGVAIAVIALALGNWRRT